MNNYKDYKQSNQIYLNASFITFAKCLSSYI